MDVRYRFWKISTLFLIIILIVGVIFLPIVESQSAELPKWEKGYSWKYKFKQPRDDFTIYVNVTSTKENIKVDEDIYPCYEANWTWITKSNKSTVTYYYTKDSLSELLLITSEDKIKFYKPPRQQLNFPLESGKRWKVICAQYTKKSKNESKVDQYYRYNYTVEGKTTINIPAGNFIVYKINRSVIGNNPNNRYEVLYYSPEAKNFVKTELHELGIIRGEQILQSYSLEGVNENDDSNNDSLIPFIHTSTFIILSVTSAVLFKIKKDSDSK